MNLDKFNLLLEGIFRRTESTFNKKRNEYAHDKDVLSHLKMELVFHFMMNQNKWLMNTYVNILNQFNLYLKSFLKKHLDMNLSMKNLVMQLII